MRLIIKLFLLLSSFYTRIGATHHITTISFIMDYKTHHAPNNNVILGDLIKVIKAPCDHIFINSALWYAFLDKLKHNRTTFNVDAWQLYDTTVGLIYMRSHTAIFHDGIRHPDFKPIDNPLDPATIDTVINRNWTADLDKIFDIDRWQSYHAQEQKKSMIYMSGHGSKRPPTDAYTSLGCGILNDHLINVALFFNTYLSVDTFVISSCYWPAARLWQALYNAGAPTVNFSLISPLATEEIIWLTSSIDCLSAQCAHKHPSFFDTCRAFASIYQDEITPELRTLLCSSDIFHEPLNKMQYPTVIIAGSSEILSIMP